MIVVEVEAPEAEVVPPTTVDPEARVERVTIDLSQVDPIVVGSCPVIAA